MRDKIRKYGGLCGALLFPAASFYLLEGYTHNGFLEVRPWAQLFNVLLFELFALILFFLFRNLKYALRAEGACAMLLGLINSYVYAFRSLPLAPWDIFSIGTAASVADNYDFTPEPRVCLVAAGFAVLLYLARFCDFRITDWGWKKSFAAAVAAGLALSLFANVLQQETFQNKHRMYNKLFTPVYMWQVNGFALTMVMELPFLAVERPKGYSAKEAKDLLASYEEEPVKEELVKPNIIVVMDEAFSDLSVLGEFEASEDCMPYYHSLAAGQKNTSTGYLEVSVCGGNTANTEFEFLTGHTMAFLPQGSVPYQQYVKGEIASLPSYLRDLGYETHAQHPFYADGWDRDKVYPLLGFSHLKFLEDFGSREYIRNYVSDKSCVDEAIRTYEEKEPGRPVFIFTVTMQNHGGYQNAGAYGNFAPHITTEGAPSESLSTYLSLVRESDEALKGLISYFEQEEEPVMAVFFGDHQPNDAVAEPVLRLNGKSCRQLSEKDTLLRYRVPYLIWTNYETKTETDADMSVNYLGVKVLEKAGLPLPAYQNFLKELSESEPFVSAARDQANAVRKEGLLNYKKMQYYQLFD